MKPNSKEDISVRTKIVCSLCGLRELCLPIGLEAAQLSKLDSLIAAKKNFKRGEYLYRGGLAFKSLYAIRSGFFKTVALHDDGREQVTGFHMMGDLMGLDAIGNGAHFCDAVALEDSEICEIPFERLGELSAELPILHLNLQKIMSREIQKDHAVMLLLGNMRAEERVAAFLLNLSERFSVRGYSAARFHLRMTREEIGSFLGLKLETVSRVFSRFQEAELVSVQKKLVELKDIDGLKRLMGTLCEN